MRTLPWFIGILGIGLIAFVYLKPHGGAPGDRTITPQPVASTRSPSKTAPPSPAVSTPVTSSNSRVSPNPPSSRPLGTPDVGRGRPDPFAALVAPEGGSTRSTRMIPQPVGGLPPSPPPGVTMGAPLAPPGAGMTVTGIMGGGSRVAIVQKDQATYIVGIGDRIGGAVVTAISGDRVVLKEHNDTFALVLSAAGGSSLGAGGASSPCVAAPSQQVGSSGPGQSATNPASPGASAPAPAAPTPSGEPSTTPSGSSSAAAPTQPAGSSGSPSVSYAPGVPPGVTAPRPTNAVGVQSPIPSGASGGSAGGPSKSYAPGVPPGVTAPEPTNTVGVQSPTPGGPSSPAAAPSQPTGGTGQNQPSVVPAAPSTGSAATPSTPERKPPLTPRTLPPC